MNEQIQRFLRRIDEHLVPLALDGERLDLYHIGRTALVMHHGFMLATRDFDIIEMRNSRLEPELIQEFGKNSPAAGEFNLYIDPVPPGLPPVPGGFQKRCKEVSGTWKVLRLWKLEVHDLAATKLKSFRIKDRQDLQMLCDQGLINANKLRDRLKAAYPLYVPGKDDDDHPDNPVQAFANLQRVEQYLSGESPSL
jgi:Nucleotidyltransferase of unknown function (DUF6036)